eukprot:15285955-Alexandrium_andersonii.AAC.1
MATLWPPTMRRRSEGSAEIHFLSQMPTLTDASKLFLSLTRNGLQTLSQAKPAAGAAAIMTLRVCPSTGS